MISAHIAKRFWPTGSRLIGCCCAVLLCVMLHAHAAVSPQRAGYWLVEGCCDVCAAPAVACMLEKHVHSFFLFLFYFCFFSLFYFYFSSYSFSFSICAFVFHVQVSIYLYMFEVYVFSLYMCMPLTVLTTCMLTSCGAVHLYFFFFQSFLSLLPFSLLILFL